MFVCRIIPIIFIPVVIGIIWDRFLANRINSFLFYGILIGRALGNNVSLDYVCFQGIDAIKNGIGK